MRILSVDVETCSEADLRKVGTSRYSEDLSTIVTVFAWAFDNEPVRAISCARGLSAVALPLEVFDHLINGGTICAWNAFFEFCILRNTLGLKLSPAQMSCTMQRALYAGLPGSLAGAGLALRLPIAHLKDTTAHRLMLKCSKPKALDPVSGARTYWADDPLTLQDLTLYCEQDVVAERAIQAFVPQLPPMEQRISILDRETNDRGIRIDLDLIPRMIQIAHEEVLRWNASANALTNGAVTSPGSQSKRIVDWISTHGITLDNTKKLTVAETLDTAEDAGLPTPVIQLLNIRRHVAKSSLAKLKTMLAAVESDHRIRGTLQYYGASRTGRFAGRIIQPQNFPRPSGDPETAINGILEGMGAEGLRLFHGEPLSVLSSCLRGTLIPSPGKVFIAFDLSQIEARIIAWLCSQLDLLEVFARGEDVYQYTADRFGLPTRQAGKAAVLGLGFGQGHKRYVVFSHDMGVDITLDESKVIVTDWRRGNSNIVDGWWALAKACMSVIELWVKDARIAHHALLFGDRIQVSCGPAKKGEPLLTIKLPSGRRLYYRNPEVLMLPVLVAMVDPNTGDPLLAEDGTPLMETILRKGLVFDGVDQMTKQWGPIRTWGSKLIENVVQAIARDVIIEAAVRIDAAKLGDLVFSVHDELVFEVPDKTAFAAHIAIGLEVTRVPSWAAGLPVAADGAVLRERYGKGS